MMMQLCYATKIASGFQKIPMEIVLGQYMFKKLKALMNWLNYFHRTYMEPYIDGLYQYQFI